MKQGFWMCVLLLGFVACGSSSTGSTTFVANDVTIEGNPSILGESSGTADNPSGFIIVNNGTVDSKLGLELTNLSVQIRVLGAAGAVLGSGVVSCSPATVAPLGSSTFQTSISLPEASYTESTSIEITPICDQGTGTVRSIALQWTNE